MAEILKTLFNISSPYYKKPESCFSSVCPYFSYAQLNSLNLFYCPFTNTHKHIQVNTINYKQRVKGLILPNR